MKNTGIFVSQEPMDRMGSQLAQLLTQASGDLSHDLTERLRVARQQAMAVRKPEPALKTQIVVQGNSLTLAGPNAPRVHFTWGVAPSLLAWVGVMMPAFAGLPLLGFALIGCYLIDRRTWPAAGLAPWLPMRLQLTIVSSLSCFLAAGAT